jgi:hypothetical protein
MSYGNSTIGSALNWRVFSLAAIAAGFALSVVACRPTPRTACNNRCKALNICNWADYVGYHTIAKFERRVAASNDPG